MRAAAFNCLLAPYGGMTPYRQRPSAFMRLLSRVAIGYGLPLVISRPIDGLRFLEGGDTHVNARGAMPSAFTWGLPPHVIRGDLKIKTNYPKLGIWRLSGVLSFY